MNVWLIKNVLKPNTVMLLLGMTLLAPTTILAQSESSSQGSVDLSELSKSEQGRANTLNCLVDCQRDNNLDSRYAQTRYDRYYETEGGVVLSDPDDEDSEVVACSEISCEPPARKAAVAAICLSRIERFDDYTNCALKCTSMGRLYDDTLFDDEPFSLYKANFTDEILRLCGRVNDRPFSDYGSTCPEIALASKEPLACSAYNDLLESTASVAPASQIITRPSRARTHIK